MFNKKIDLRSRREMVLFLKKHFRYHTAGSWNGATSYANCVKVYRLNLGNENEEKLLSAIETDEYYEDVVNPLICAFGEAHNWAWQAGFNGRNNGYLVLYRGGKKDSEYKSYCPDCGQRNFQNVSKNSHTCGVCGGERIDYERAPQEILTYPMKGTDMYEDFEEWSLAELRERVRLVCEFDTLCDEIREATIRYLETHEFKEEVTFVPQIRKKAVVIE